MFATIREVCEADKRKLTTSEVLILVLISSMTNDNHEGAWPSRGTLAKWSGLDRRTVKRTLDKLESRGIISLKPRHDESGRQLSNIYIVNVDKLAPGRVAPMPPSGVAPVPSSGVAPVPPKDPEKREKNKSRTQRASKKPAGEKKPPTRKQIEKAAERDAEKQAFIEARDWWVKWYESTFEGKCPFNAKEAKHLKELLTHFDHDPEQLSAFVLRASVEIEDNWLLGQMAALSTINSQLGKLQAAMSKQNGAKREAQRIVEPSSDAPAPSDAARSAEFQAAAESIGAWSIEYPWCAAKGIPSRNEVVAFLDALPEDHADQDLIGDKLWDILTMQFSKEFDR